MIKGTPSPGLCYNPNDPKYWDEEGLRQELERVFEVCNWCRLCFNLCPSFPALFQAIDTHGGDVRQLTQDETARVIDLCYQCKVCYVKCPYTPDDGHEFQLDFPRLMLRAVALRARRGGFGLRSRLLSRPDRIGRLGSLAAPLVNWANRQPVLRRGLEALLGIHRDKRLPVYHRETLEAWLQRQAPRQGLAEEAVLFVSCAVNFNAPEVGRDCVEVYARNGIALSCASNQCCGMPALEAGDVRLAQKLCRENVESLLPHVRQGKKVVVLEPTCAYMLRKEYPELAGVPEAREVAAATRDACEFLFELKQQGRLNRDFRSSPGTIAYHLPCHLKAQNIGYRSRDLMRLIPGATLRLVDQCSGHDGTWAMKKQFFPLSLLTAQKASAQIQSGDVDLVASDCILAGLHLEQVTGRKPLHPIQVLARAYREDGFARSGEESKS
jgi:Fe-S oxidoreductase